MLRLSKTVFPQHLLKRSLYGERFLFEINSTFVLILKENK
ncbi:hypothetical protein JCM19301_3988 [Jejuia pallidilutea]|uniref:Uncharacterized protein n=1 Tax=Jejuia pallidilutea TaxID=504487 RepID=A0A090W3R4_9FLAO|nr:hypothetical protein JCM19301_3988 [Jejuia pallidilutea]GAL70089.1 hypothetical protein JCM19302_2664 [Jejuia pallidilutea]GAL88929.1 hypothetical protein JCM19538_1918 [Jejuia pallidilutea]